uniref:Uncharacterized protein n=1 Tax=Arundo donax TaxID=35708 RepID=A0A0A8YEH0_ARUDO
MSSEIIGLSKLTGLASNLTT